MSNWYLLLNAVLVVVTARAMLSPRTAPDLPAEIYEQIASWVGDLETLAQLSAVSRLVHGRIRDLVTLRGLFHYRLTAERFTDLVRCFLQTANRANPHLHVYVRDRVTPQLAMGLYDAVNRSSCTETERRTLLRLLSVWNPAAFPGRTYIPNLFLYPAVLSAVIPDRPLADDGLDWLDQIPAPITDLVRDLIPSRPHDHVTGVSPERIAEVRARYPPPYDQVFPHNGYISWQLLLNISKCQWAALVNTAAVVLALLRLGIRFDFCDYILSLTPCPDQIVDIYPMLARPDLRHTWGLDRYVVWPLEKLVRWGQLDTAVALLRIPEFADYFLLKPSISLRVLKLAVVNGGTVLIDLIVHQERSHHLINVPDDEHGRTLLHYAYMHGQDEIVSLLLSIPNTNVDIKDRYGNRASQYRHTKL